MVQYNRILDRKQTNTFFQFCIFFHQFLIRLIHPKTNLVDSGDNSYVTQLLFSPFFYFSLVQNVEDVLILIFFLFYPLIQLCLCLFLLSLFFLFSFLSSLFLFNLFLQVLYLVIFQEHSQIVHIYVVFSCHKLS